MGDFVSVFNFQDTRTKFEIKALNVQSVSKICDSVLLELYRDMPVV
jgi:hypothetical protein